jgi:hypothetical protein
MTKKFILNNLDLKLNSAEQNEGHRQYWCSVSSCSWMDGWMDGRMGGWMDGWMEIKAVLRIAYSNKNT